MTTTTAVDVPVEGAVVSDSPKMPLIAVTTDSVVLHVTAGTQDGGAAYAGVTDPSMLPFL